MLTVVKDTADAAARPRPTRAPTSTTALDAVVDGGVRVGAAHARSCCPCSRRTASSTPAASARDPRRGLRRRATRAARSHVADVVVRGRADRSRSSRSNDWDDNEYLYCTEFLLFGDGLDRDADRTTTSRRRRQRAGRRRRRRVQGPRPHRRPGRGARVRDRRWARSPRSTSTTCAGSPQARAAEHRAPSAARADGAAQAVGFVAVAAGDGPRAHPREPRRRRRRQRRPDDEPVDRGAARRGRRSVDADAVIVLPNNRNIVMAAQQVAAAVASSPVGVVPTTLRPAGVRGAARLRRRRRRSRTNVAAMTEAAAAVRTGEVTTAVKDAKGKVGDDHGRPGHRHRRPRDRGRRRRRRRRGAAPARRHRRRRRDAHLLGGRGPRPTRSSRRSPRALGEAHPELEVESHRGDQPLYPVIMAVE